MLGVAGLSGAAVPGALTPSCTGSTHTKPDREGSQQAGPGALTPSWTWSAHTKCCRSTHPLEVLVRSSALVRWVLSRKAVSGCPCPALKGHPKEQLWAYIQLLLRTPGFLVPW